MSWWHWCHLLVSQHQSRLNEMPALGWWRGLQPYLNCISLETGWTLEAINWTAQDGESDGGRERGTDGKRRAAGGGWGDKGRGELCGKKRARDYGRRRVKRMLTSRRKKENDKEKTDELNNQSVLALLTNTSCPYWERWLKSCFPPLLRFIKVPQFATFVLRELFFRTLLWMIKKTLKASPLSVKETTSFDFLFREILQI